MKILFFTQRYPGKHNTSDYVFVKQLVDAIADFGHECHVIAPYNIFHYRSFINNHDNYKVGHGCVYVYRPYYLSFSDYKIFRCIVSLSKRHAIRRAQAKLPNDIDVVYGHFWKSAYEGYKYAHTHNLPLFVATGESNISDFFSLKPDRSEFCNYVRGVICVSSKNRDESISLGLTVLDKCVVCPNAVNENLFCRLQRSDCRKILNIPESAFVLIFVGWFIDRKGVLRVSDAINRIKGEKVYSLFVGKGPQKPNCDGILFQGSVSHDELPVYLNAADVFVLPTKHEGCCNAIVEAVACGLPVISSNYSFNWDILDNTNSILINPDDINELSLAITTLRDDLNLRERLANGSLKKASIMTIQRRAESIIRFIQNKMYE